MDDTKLKIRFSFSILLVLTAFCAASNLTALEIVGPNQVLENSYAMFRAIAHYEGGASADVTETASWTIEPNAIAYIDEYFVLRTGDIETDQMIIISADYTLNDTNIIAQKNVTVFVTCPMGTALSFDGDDDYVSINDQSLPASGPYTVCMWLYADSYYQSYWVRGGHDQDACWIHYYINDNARFTIGTDDRGTGRLKIKDADGRNFENYRIPHDTWAHVAVVFDIDGNFQRVYRDGILTENVYLKPGYSGYTDPAWNFIGTQTVLGRQGDGGNFYEGLMDEVQIWDIPLTQLQIWQKMHLKLNGSENNLALYLSLDEADGQIVYDQTAGGSDGILGSTPEFDISDPGWIISQAPVGICTDPVPLDIKPDSCPNPLNLSSKGLLPVAIPGSEDFDVTEIDVASIRLEGISPIRSGLDDVITPLTEPNECDCSDQGSDGFTDLTLKFDTQLIVAELLESNPQLSKHQVLNLSITGNLLDGRRIDGADCVELVGNVIRATAARKSDINDDGLVDLLDFAQMANFWLEPAF